MEYSSAARPSDETIGGAGFCAAGGMSAAALSAARLPCRADSSGGREDATRACTIADAHPPLRDGIARWW